MRYVSTAGGRSDCVFCAALAAGDDRQALIVERGKLAFLILNAFPYASGHLMAALNRHGCSLEDATPAELTEMMRQYRELKRRYPDYLLLFRLGDFYELFFDDARVASRLLQIALTSRQKGEGAIPMAGIPHHAADGYIARLIRAGQKVAVCEQLEEPAKGRKIVRRDVVRVITPGTITDTQFLDGARNNFLLAAHATASAVGVA